VVYKSHGFQQRSEILFDDVGCRVGLDVYESSTSGFVQSLEGGDPASIRCSARFPLAAKVFVEGHQADAVSIPYRKSASIGESCRQDPLREYGACDIAR